jgi:hypothetical protein
MRTRDAQEATLFALAGPLAFALESGVAEGHPSEAGRTLLANMHAAPGLGGVAKDSHLAAAALSMICEALVARVEAQEGELEQLRERVASLEQAKQAEAKPSGASRGSRSSQKRG